MSGIVVSHTLTAGIVIHLTEAEARALAELAKFGPDCVTRAFAEQMSSTFDKEHRAGMASLLTRVRQDMGAELSRIVRARNAFSEKPPETT